MEIEPKFVQTWLDGYVVAWRSYDPAEIRALFTEDALYRYRPWEVPLNGVEEIVASWLENPDQADSWQAWYRVEMVDGDRAVAIGETTYVDGTDYANLWVMRFAPDGRCADFTEWFMTMPVTGNAADE